MATLRGRIGVNSFKGAGEALNFAVAINDVEKFLKAAQDGAFEPAAASTGPCEPKALWEGRSKDSTAFMRSLDMDCGGKANAVLIVPDDESKPVEFRPVEFRLDTNNDGRTDIWIFDDDRDGKWDASYWDTDFDGKPDVVGHHPDGGRKPARLEKYQPKS